MSRTDNTRPYDIRVADLNGIKARGVKLDDLADIVSSTPNRHYYGIGENNRGVRRRHQTIYSRQRRRRDKLACHMASAFDYDAEILPVRGDRKNVDWDLS